MTKCAPWITWGPGGETLILFDQREGTYHMLNATASLIWKALSSGQQKTEIYSTLASRYGVSPDLVAADVDAFVQSGLKNSLLVIE